VAEVLKSFDPNSSCPLNSMKKDTNPPISRKFEEVKWEANYRRGKNETQLYSSRDVFEG
jgi:hypothetical protein